MNKRIKNKIIKNSNMKIYKRIFKELSQYFTIKNIEYLDGYFIFFKGNKSVCHFRIKETPKWKYGVWVEGDSYKIFGEHEELIDKFKPSATYLSYKNNLKKFIEDVKNISKNPKLYFIDSLTFGSALYPYKKYNYDDGEVYYEGYQVIRKYNKETKLYDKYERDKSITQEQFVNKHYQEFQEQKLKEKQEEEYDRKYAFNFFKELINFNRNIIAVGIKDNNINGFESDPRYRIMIVINEKINQDTVEKLYNKLDETIKNKNYNCMKGYNHHFELKGLYDDLKDIKECQYRYLGREVR